MCVTIWRCWVRTSGKNWRWVGGLGMTWLRKPNPTKGCKANGRTRTRTWRTKACHVISVRAAVILTAVSLWFIFVLTSHLRLGFQGCLFHLRCVCISRVPLHVLPFGQSGWMLETFVSVVNMVAARKLGAWVKIPAVGPCLCYVSFWTALPFL